MRLIQSFLTLRGQLQLLYLLERSLKNTSQDTKHHLWEVMREEWTNYDKSLPVGDCDGEITQHKRKKNTNIHTETMGSQHNTHISTSC